MRFYTQSHISERIAETPEGYLICHDVPIARTGFMEYEAGEVPVEPIKGNPVVQIERTEAFVFDPVAVGSFEGKPVTIGHPREDVTPANWKELAKGHAQDVRRGEGEAADLLLADLIITDADAIALVRGGLRDISCGYDTTYEQIKPGYGRQSQIRGNHIALVQQGRCGSRCRINDQSEATMSKEKKTRASDWLPNFFRRPEVQKALDEAQKETPPADEIPPKDPKPPAQDEGGDRLASLESKVEELTILVRSLAEGKTGDEDDPKPEGEKQPAQPDVPDTKAADAARVATVDADTMQGASILMPGISVTATDSRCAVQRLALRTATKDAAVDKVVKAALGGSTLDSCDCVTLDAAFGVAKEVVAERNNGKTADSLVQATTRDFGQTVTPADINAANEAFHKGGK